MQNSVALNRASVQTNTGVHWGRLTTEGALGGELSVHYTNTGRTEDEEAVKVMVKFVRYTLYKETNNSPSGVSIANKTCAEKKV